MSLQIEALSPIMWTIIIAVALVLIAAVVFTWKSSAMSTRKMVTIAMLTAVYVVLNFAGTVRLGWINISVASLPVIVGAMLYGPVGGLLVGLLGAFMGQLLTYGVTATTILWILPQAARGLLVGVYAKHCGYKFSSGQLTLALIGTALVVTALNTGAMYIDSVIYNYYSYAYVFGGLVVRIISGAATAVLMVFVAPPVVNLLNRSLDTVRTNAENIEEVAEPLLRERFAAFRALARLDTHSAQRVNPDAHVVGIYGSRFFHACGREIFMFHPFVRATIGSARSRIGLGDGGIRRAFWCRGGRYGDSGASDFSASGQSR